MAYIKRPGTEDEELKASGGAAEGIPITAGGTAGGGGPSGNDYTKSNFVSGKAILDRNKTATMPDFTTGFQTKIGEGKQALNKSYEDWNKIVGDSVKTVDINPDRLDKAISGANLTARANIGSTIAAPPKVVGYNKFDPNIGISEMNALNTGAGIQNAYGRQQQQQGNFGYTQGQAALDSTLFGRDPRSREQVQSALNQRRELYHDADTLAGRANQAKGTSERYIARKIDGLKQNLTGKASKITSAAEQRAQDLAGKVDKNEIKKSLQKPLKKSIQAWIKKNSTDPRIGALLGDPEVMKSFQRQLDYFTDGGYYDTSTTDDLFNYGDFSNPVYETPEADQWNAINEMLGSGKKVSNNTSAANPSINDSALDKRLLADLELRAKEVAWQREHG